MRHGTTVFAVMTLGIAATVGLAACGFDVINPPSCTVTVDGDTVELDTEQTANAATIAAVGLRRGMSDRAIVVALATARQESKLLNIDYGDRDSKGLFQQRPSQGWGTEEEIMDPQYAADRFYEHLEQIPDWEDMRVTDAAQAVQRSAFPEEYEKWADDSQILASGFTGATGSALSCSRAGDSPTAPSMKRLTQSLRHDWGEETIYSESGNGLSVPVDTPESGWQYASWLVAHAGNHAVSAVEYNGRTWSAEDGGWSDNRTESADPNAVTAQLESKS